MESRALAMWYLGLGLVLGFYTGYEYVGVWCFCVGCYCFCFFCVEVEVESININERGVFEFFIKSHNSA